MKRKEPDDDNNFQERGFVLSTRLIPITNDIWDKHILSKISFLEHNILRLVSKETKDSIIKYYKCNDQYRKLSCHQTFWNVLEKIEIMAAKKGYLNLIEWVYENLLWCTNNFIRGCISSNSFFGFGSCNHAAREGNLDVLKWLIGHGAAHDEDELLKKAAKGGHIHVLEWVMEKIGWNFENVCDSNDIFDCGIISGNLKVVKWLKEHGCNSEDCEKEAAMSGNIEIFQLVTKNYKNHEWNKIVGYRKMDGIKTNITKSEECIIGAAKNGHLHMIGFIMDNGGSCHDTNELYIKATEGGHIHIIEWAIKKGYKCNYNILIEESSKFGHLDIIKLLLKNGGEGKFCSIDKFYVNAASGGYLEIIKWGIENGYKCCFDDVLVRATLKGHLNIIKWLKETHLKNEFESNKKYKKKIGIIGIIGTAKSNFNILKWAYKKEISSQIKEENGTSLIKNLKEMGYEFSIEVVEHICNDGTKDDLKILFWALKNGLEWNKNTCELPSQLGRLDILEILIGNGCPWNSCICINAVDKNRLDILQWAINNGCLLWNFNDLITKSKSKNYINIYNWLLSIPKNKRKEAQSAALRA
jgi:hypothetical protein